MIQQKVSDIQYRHKKNDLGKVPHQKSYLDNGRISENVQHECRSDIRIETKFLLLYNAKMSRILK